MPDAKLLLLIQGGEIHPGAAAKARMRLAAALISFGMSSTEACGIAAKIVHNKDFFIEVPTEQTYSALIGSPVLT